MIDDLVMNTCTIWNSVKISSLDATSVFPNFEVLFYNITVTRALVVGAILILGCTIFDILKVFFPGIWMKRNEINTDTQLTLSWVPEVF